MTPALATMDELKKLRADVTFSFIGRMYAMEGDTTPSAEYTLVTAKKIPFYPIQAGRLQRRFTRYTVPSLMRVPVGLMQSYSILRKLKPDVVVSFGGYVAVPVCVAAKGLGIPVVTHEQTLMPGLANRIIAKFADVVALSFEETIRYYENSKFEIINSKQIQNSKKQNDKRRKIVVTGNPIRQEIFEVVGQQPFANSQLPTVFVTCGNQGSHLVNRLVFQHLYELLTFCCVFHQTGKNALYDDYDTSQTLMQTLPSEVRDRYIAQAYVGPEDIGAIFARSEVVVSRGGVNTLCELLALGKKGIIIPGHAEQAVNAEFYHQSGLGVHVKPDEAEEVFVEAIKDRIAYRASDAEVKQAKELISLDASRKLAEVILQC